ncbi:MAG TPA: hypothetical protein VHV78_16870 [Gemmatimonadaceae bacterium]|nr:hypothetical protein [Gemmatimonadaceae bacterium]
MRTAGPQRSARSWTARTAIGLFAAAASIAGCRGADNASPALGPPTSISIVSGDGQVGLVGTSLSVPLVVVVEAKGIVLAGAAVDFAIVSGAATLAPGSVVTDASGQAKASVLLGAASGVVNVTATVSGTPLSVAFTEAGGTTTAALACATGSATLPAVGSVTPAVGGSGICLGGGGNTTGAEYAVAAFYGNSDNTSFTSFTVRSHGGVTGIATADVIPVADVAVAGGGRVSGPRTTMNLRQTQFDAQLRTAARRTLSPMMSTARALLPLRPARSSVPANPTIGSFVTLNANGNAGQPCSNPINIVARVAAVSNLAIVVADTSNPAGGFSNAEYATFAATFDTLISPIDVAAFGQPTDIDGNGKTIIFFTKEVNRLSPRGSQGVIEGFFHERDLFPTTSTNALQGCATSNVAEMYYSIVPDPQAMYGDARTKAYVQSNTPSTLVHEFQHLINAGRRIYVNDAPVFEEVWLNEGLSHIAEELLYYHVAGLAPRQNIGLTALTVDTSSVNDFDTYQGANFARFQIYIGEPVQSSPFAENDSLQTRGATWNLLRYLADHRASNDANTWQLLDNSTTSGLQNLANVFAPDQRIPTVMGQIRDWATSLVADDITGQSNAVFADLSWNMRSIFPRLADLTGVASGRYPLQVFPVDDGNPVNATVDAGGVAFIRFVVPPGGSGSIDWSSASGLPSSPLLQMSVVRTR